MNSLKKKQFGPLFGLALIVSCGFALLPQQLGAQNNLSAIAKPVQAEPKKRIPRFVSLKKDRVNVRRGPSTSHKVDFVYTRKGLPVEIIAEFDLWRRIRDSEGDEGWVYHTLLSSTRTVLIAPWGNKQTLPLFRSADNSSTVAYAETGVLGSVPTCNGKRCLLVINGDTQGWISQSSLWGVYPNEVF